MMSPFWRKTLPLIPHRPFSALRAIFWHLARRKVRAANIVRDASRGSPFAYRHWLLAQEEEAVQMAAATSSEMAQWPSITVVIHGTEHGKEELRERSRRSVQRQLLGPGKLLECETRSLAEVVSQAPGDYLFLLRTGDRLSPSAIFRMARFLHSDQVPMIFGDEDFVSADNGSLPSPWFKGEWNRELFLALDYLSSAVAVRADLARAASPRLENSVSPVDALLLHATELAGGQVAHLPAILVHTWGNQPEGSERLREVSLALDPHAQCKAGPFGTIHVQWPLPPEAPLVSIVVPTRDRLELLRTCISSVEAHTSYRHYEWVVVDNGSSEANTLEYLAGLSTRPDARVIRSEGPFNFSTLNNLGVREAAGSYVLLLNNDTEAFDDEWLTEMMRYAARDYVGAVGAKLLYDDGSLQHAGVVVGMGEAAGHAHRFLAAGEPGYFRQPHAAQEVSAVTAACLLVRKDHYLAVGGLDEEQFAVAYNDVDFCLKLKQVGLRNIYTPHAKLLHHESKSRGSDFSPANEQRYLRELRNLQDRWGTRTFNDPLHSRHLDRYSETFRPSF
jgi:GT2 family glycosyltransferase